MVHEAEGAQPCASVGRAKYLRAGGGSWDEGEPIVRLSIGELRALVRDAVAEAMGMKGGPVLIDKSQLAERFGISVTHVDELRRRGMPTVLVGAAVRFEADRCVEWLRRIGESPAA